jgi:hypothetical protein|uniref:Uncharacterized protein n=1 Tax=Zea mays TaxID=4577 RepID=C0P5N1_MAIZE|nr:unknown [Zea mays]
MAGHELGLIRVQAVGVGSTVQVPDTALVVAGRRRWRRGACVPGWVWYRFGFSYFSPSDFAPFLSRSLMMQLHFGREECGGRRLLRRWICL